MLLLLHIKQTKGLIMKTTLKSIDNHRQNDTKISWYDVEGVEYGLSDHNGELTLLDSDGCPIEPINDHDNVLDALKIAHHNFTHQDNDITKIKFPWGFNTLKTFKRCQYVIDPTGYYSQNFDYHDLLRNVRYNTVNTLSAVRRFIGWAEKNNKSIIEICDDLAQRKDVRKIVFRVIYDENNNELFPYAKITYRLYDFYLYDDGIVALFLENNETIFFDANQSKYIKR